MPQITIQSAQVYSKAGEMCYQLDYSDGTSVRAVESRGHFIRKEFKTAEGWKLAGRAYVVAHNRTRGAERIKATVMQAIRAEVAA